MTVFRVAVTPTLSYTSEGQPDMDMEAEVKTDTHSILIKWDNS